jgi:TRAP-type C4-dicarboxylate transport system substrate-binding protein
MKNLGLHPVSLPSSEVLPALASGMADALYATPLAVGAMQWFGVADNMADMRVAPFLGGILISDRVWSQIPDDIKPELIESAQAIGRDLDKKIVELENDAVEQMKGYGLKVNPVPPEAVEEWKELFEQGQRQSGKNIYSREFMDYLVETIQEYRNGE